MLLEVHEDTDVTANGMPEVLASLVKSRANKN